MKNYRFAEDKQMSDPSRGYFLLGCLLLVLVEY